GFKVSKPLLERAFRETYGLEPADVLAFDEDLVIGTYRKAVSDIVPRLTEIAWRDKHDAIERLVPGISRDRFVFTFSRGDYEQEFGTGFRKPGFVARVLGFFYCLLPKIGPLRPLKFETPTPEAEPLFLTSLHETPNRFRDALKAVRDN